MMLRYAVILIYTDMGIFIYTILDEGWWFTSVRSQTISFCKPQTRISSFFVYRHDHIVRRINVLWSGLKPTVVLIVFNLVD